MEKVILRRAVESVILSRIGERCVFALLWPFRVSVDLGGCRGLKGEVEGQFEGGSDGGREEEEAESV